MTPTHIVVHHSSTKDGETFSWDAIRQYHIQTNKWQSIGYHYGIERIGVNYEILLGRLPDQVGAHCKDASMNQKSIGICCVGNFDDETPPVLMVIKLEQLIQHLMRLYKIPRRNVLGHREAQLMAGIPMRLRKTCPGTRFDMEALRRSLLD